MKRTIKLLFCFVFFGLAGHAQPWQSYRQYGGDEADDFAVSTRLPSGEFLVAFSYDSQLAIFGQDTINVPSWYDFDIGLMKTSTTGDVIWAKRFGGANNGPALGLDYPRCIAYDSVSGSIILAGTINGRNATAGSCTLSQITVMVLDSIGECRWSLYGLYGYYSSIDDVCPDESGNVYVAGSTAYIGSIGGTVIDSGAFVIKYDIIDGNVKWFRNVLPARSSIRIRYRNGNLYFAGFSGRPSITVDGIQLSGYDNDFLVGKMDTSGSIEWVHRYGGPGLEYLPSIALDDESNVLVSTRFEDSCRVDTTTLYTSGAKGYLTMKLDSMGNLQWIRSGLASQLMPESITTGPDGSVLSNVLIYGTGYFGPDTLEPGSNPNQAYLLKYSAQGNYLGYISVENSVWGQQDVYVEPNGELTVWTSFQIHASIPPFNLVSNGARDIVMARHAPLVGIPEPGQRMNNSLVVYANPNQGNFRIEVPDRFQRAAKLNLRILDPQGRVVMDKTLTATDSRLEMQAGELASGLYELLLSDGKQTARGRVVIE